MDQAQAVGGSGAQVTFGTERFDSGGVFAASVWTCPTTGYYQFFVHLTFEPGAAAVLELHLYLNGGPGVGTAVASDSSTSATQPCTLQVNTGPLSLTAGDTIAVYSYQAAGAACVIVGDINATYISGMRVA